MALDFVTKRLRVLDPLLEGKASKIIRRQAWIQEKLGDKVPATCVTIQSLQAQFGSYADTQTLCWLYCELFAPRENMSPNLAWLHMQFATVEERSEWRLTALALFADVLESEGF